MKKYYLLVLFICITHLAWGGPPEDVADSLLDSISKQKNFQATFTYRFQSEQGEASEEQVGSIAVQGHQYRLAMGGQEIVSDGKIVWNYLPEANEVQINDYNPEQGASIPWLLFTNWRKSHKFHDICYQNIYKKKGEGYYKRDNGTYDIYCTVILVARDLESNIQKLVITVDQNKRDIKHLEVLDGNQQQHSFSITKFKTDLALDEAFFKFIPENYQDIEVIDMRE